MEAERCSGRRSASHDVVKRIAVGEGPNGECGAPSWFQNAQDFPNCLGRIREEHGGEPARDRVECLGWKRKVIGRAHFKLHGVELFICGRAASRCDHLWGWIDAADTAFIPDKFCNSESGFAGPCADIQDMESTDDFGLLNESLTHRSEHLPDNPPMLLPILSRLPPKTFEAAVGRHTHQRFIFYRCTINQ